MKPAAGCCGATPGATADAGATPCVELGLELPLEPPAALVSELEDDENDGSPIARRDPPPVAVAGSGCWVVVVMRREYSSAGLLFVPVAPVDGLAAITSGN